MNLLLSSVPQSHGRRPRWGNVATTCKFVLACGLAGALPATAAEAALRVAALFTEGAVLQQDQPHPVWGWSEPGAKVEVGFAGQTHSATAAADGRWQVVLDPLASNGHGATLTVRSGAETLSVSDILVGEVWLCSGQSNMEYSVRLAPDAAELLAAADLPWLRHFKVVRKEASAPEADVTGGWLRSTPTNAERFTAVGFHFAKALHARLGVPVGLVNSTWGATGIRNWSPGGAQYNGMITPLAPFPFRGVLWYQGEGDTGRAVAYRSEFPALINAWRNHWDLPLLPFLFVQLPNYNVPNDTGGLKWAELRASQAAALNLPATGMIVTIDVGMADEGHPPDKSAIGQRLARLALVDVIHAATGNATSPYALRATAEGSLLRIHFAQADGGLVLDTGPGADGAFAVAGSDGIFHPATPQVDGSTLLLSAAQVSEPFQGRYAWANNPPVALFNPEGLPASPFWISADSAPASSGPANSYLQDFATAAPGLTRSTYAGLSADGVDESILPENPPGWVDGPPVSAASNRSPWSIANSSDSWGNYLLLDGADRFDGNGRAYATVAVPVPSTASGDHWRCGYDFKVDTLLADGTADSVHFGIGALGDKPLFGLGGSNVYIAEIGFTLAGNILPLEGVRPVLRITKSSGSPVDLAQSAPLPLGFLNTSDTFRISLSGTYASSGTLTLTATVENLSQPGQPSATVTGTDASPYSGGTFGIRHRSASPSSSARLAELRIRHDQFFVISEKAPSTTLPTPAGLMAMPGDGSITVHWPAQPEATDILLERGADGLNFAPLRFLRTATMQHVDHAVSTFSAYSYRFRTQSGDSASLWSETVSARVDHPQAHWRETHFGYPAPAGPAAYLADPDGDGVVNFMEYALGLDPLAPDDGPILIPGLDELHRLTVAFRPVRAELVYLVEGSADLQAWQPLTTLPGGSSELASVTDPGFATTHRFLRLRVIQPE